MIPMIEASKPPRVALLPEAVANQIAAGEVVERPASVVKELVENALDARATRVKVEALGGGQQLIRVTDDGHGMSPDDARLALTRHATSKVRGLADLERVGTLGFRGEALPSIASVSRFELATTEAGAETGRRLTCQAGGALQVECCPPVLGTTVQVEDLFFNTPVRRKFLKQASTEIAHISDAVSRLALSHPGVGFKLLAEGRSVLDVPPMPDGGDPSVRLSRILGRSTAAGCRPIEDDGLERSIRVSGFLGVPPLSDRGTRSQSVFVNGRFVRDRTIQRAIGDAYQGRLPKGRHPVVILFVDLSPDEVDVNVHPQKLEVRFARSGEVYRSVQAALRRGLARAEIGPAPVDLDPSQRRRAAALANERTVVHPLGVGPPANAPTERTSSEPAETDGLRGADLIREPSPYRGHRERLLAAFAQAPKRLSRWTSPPAPDAMASNPPQPFVQAGAAETSERPADSDPRPAPPPPFEGTGSAAAGPGSNLGLDKGLEERGQGREVGPGTRGRPVQLGLAAAPPHLSTARRLGVVFGRYLLLEADAALWFADLVGMQARVTLESEAAQDELGALQPLLIPIELSIAPSLHAVVREGRSLLSAAGLELEFEAETARLLAAPARAQGLDLQGLVDGALEALVQERSPKQAVVRLIAEGRAQLVVAGRVSSSPDAIEALIDRLERCSVRDLGPDGRPLVVALTSEQVTRLFGRAG